MDMLDMGVGGGRTTKYFAPLVRFYIGADYAFPMLKSAKKDMTGILILLNVMQGQWMV